MSHFRLHLGRGAPLPPPPPPGTLSAPSLGYPSPIASNPATIAVHIGADWQTGDVLKLARSSSASMTSPTLLTHTLTDADIIAGTISLGLSGVTLAGITYFRAYGSHGGVDSGNLSNIVTWGDTVAPTITTSATPTHNYETQPLALALTATDTGGVPALLSDGSSSGWLIAGGVDQLQFQIALVSGVPTLQWTANGVQSYSTPNNSTNNAANPYVVTVRAIDYTENFTDLTISQYVDVVDQTPDAYTFTNVTNAALSTLYTSNTVTISGLTPGLQIPTTFSGPGTYSKNGGPYVSTSPLTAQNGDTFSLRATSGSANNMSLGLSLWIGTATPTWTVATPTSLVVGTGMSSGSFPASPYTFTGVHLGAGRLNLFMFNDYGRPVTSVIAKKSGQSDVALTLANGTWNGDILVDASDWTIEVTGGSPAPVGWFILPITATGVTPTPTQTDSETFASGASNPITGATSFTIPSSGVAFRFVQSFASSTVQFTETATDGATVLATYNFINFDGNKAAIIAHQMTANGPVTFTYAPNGASGDILMAAYAYGP